MAALRRISSPISTNFYYKRINTDGDFSNDVQRRSSPWVCPGTHVQSTTGIKYHWHVNRSFFPRSNAQIVRINTIETQTERGTTVSRLPINYHCHQSVVIDNGSVDFVRVPDVPKEGRSGTSSDIVHLAVVKRATNHRWYGEYQAGLITVCTK